MSDYISRQAAIEALRRLYIENPQIDNDFVYDMALDQADDVIKRLPSAQPEIIRCKDCKHRDEYGSCKWWRGLTLTVVSPSTDDEDFCSYARRRT